MVNSTVSFDPYFGRMEMGRSGNVMHGVKYLLTYLPKDILIIGIEVRYGDSQKRNLRDELTQWPKYSQRSPNALSISMVRQELSSASTVSAFFL